MPLKDKYISSYLVRRQLFFCCLCACWLRVICKASLCAVGLELTLLEVQLKLKVMFLPIMYFRVSERLKLALIIKEHEDHLYLTFSFFFFLPMISELQRQKRNDVIGNKFLYLGKKKVYNQGLLLLVTVLNLLFLRSLKKIFFVSLYLLNFSNK